jgi:hypothetical protein
MAGRMMIEKILNILLWVFTLVVGGMVFVACLDAISK